MQLLLTLDGSAFAEAAIPVAGRIARSTHCDVHLLAVFEPRLLDQGVLPHWEGEGDHPNADPPPMDLDMEFALEHYLESVARQFPDNAVRPSVRVGPHPAEQIAAYADANEIDLIVMATHGYTGMHRLVHGSVAGSVLRSGVAPVALVRPAMVSEPATARSDALLGPTDN